MATTFSSTPSKVQVSGSLSSVRAGLPNLDDNTGFNFTGPSYTNGVAVGQCDRRYVAQLSLAASGTTTLNLSSLLDPFGNSIAFLRVKELFVQLLASPAATSILVGAAGSNPWVNWITAGTAALRIRSGMCFYLGAALDATGFVVVASTGDQLKIASEDAVNAALVNVWIAGCSA
jgi:hypothetical protein